MYSKDIAKKQTDNLCVRCETHFKHWSEYHAHMIGPKCKLKIIPLNTSGRNKAEIVKAWESNQNKEAIIG